jgi:hypothetical protein
MQIQSALEDVKNHKKVAGHIIIMSRQLTTAHRHQPLQSQRSREGPHNILNWHARQSQMMLNKTNHIYAPTSQSIMTPAPIRNKHAASMVGQSAIDPFLKPMQTVVLKTDDNATIVPKDGSAAPTISPLARRRIIIDDDDDDKPSAEPQNSEVQPSKSNSGVILQPQRESQGPLDVKNTPAMKMTVTAKKRRHSIKKVRQPNNRTRHGKTPKEPVSSSDK